MYPKGVPTCTCLVCTPCGLADGKHARSPPVLLWQRRRVREQARRVRNLQYLRFSLESDHMRCCRAGLLESGISALAEGSRICYYSK